MKFILLKSVLLISLLVIGQISFASLGPCSKKLYQNSKAINAIQYLQNYEGKFSLGSCSVEIQVCDSSNKEVEGTGSMAADMLIIDKDGFQRYIPFFVLETNTNWSKEKIFQDNKALVYRFKDKNFDPETGKDELWDIEIIKKDDSKNLDYIEIGYSSESERKNDTNKKWIACGTEREEYLRTHPYKHYLKSIWWWLTRSEK